MRILAVGNATLDIVNIIDRYPAEDTEARAQDQYLCRGGNATNTLVVLSQLNHICSWAGVLSDEPDAAYIKLDLDRFGVDYATCRLVKGGRVPTSCVALNRTNGSRTIIHHRDLPEYRSADFAALVLSDYDWIHFEGRAVDQVAEMMALLDRDHPRIPYSLEVEKPRDGIAELFQGAEVILFSRQFAECEGFDSAPAFLQEIRRRTEAPSLVCGWGEEGGYAAAANQEILYCPAFTPALVQDTLGAGDVFNAAIIHGLLNKSSLAQTLGFACRLAGLKCGQFRLHPLDEEATGLSIDDKNYSRCVKDILAAKDYGER